MVRMNHCSLATVDMVALDHLETKHSQFVPREGGLRKSNQSNPRSTAENLQYINTGSSQAEEPPGFRQHLGFAPTTISLIMEIMGAKTLTSNQNNQYSQNQKLFPYIGIEEPSPIEAYRVSLAEKSDKYKPSRILLCTECATNFRHQQGTYDHKSGKKIILQLDPFSSFRAQSRFFGPNRFSRQSTSDSETSSLEKGKENIDFEPLCNLLILSSLSLSFLGAIVQNWFPEIVPIQPHREKSSTRSLEKTVYRILSQTLEGPRFIELFRGESSSNGFEEVTNNRSDNGSRIHKTSVHQSEMMSPKGTSVMMSPKDTSVCGNCLKGFQGLEVLKGFEKQGLSALMNFCSQTVDIPATASDLDETGSLALASTPTKTNNQPDAALGDKATIFSQATFSSQTVVPPFPNRAGSKKRKRDQLTGKEKDSRFHLNFITPLTKFKKRMKLSSRRRISLSRKSLGIHETGLTSVVEKTDIEQARITFCPDYYRKQSVLEILRSVIVTSDISANENSDEVTLDSVRLQKSFYKKTCIHEKCKDESAQKILSGRGHLGSKQPFYKKYELRLQQLKTQNQHKNLSSHNINLMNSSFSAILSCKSSEPDKNGSKVEKSSRSAKVIKSTAYHKSSSGNNSTRVTSIGNSNEEVSMMLPPEQFSELLSHFPISSSELCTADSVLEDSVTEEVKAVKLSSLDELEIPLNILSHHQEESIETSQNIVQSEHPDSSKHQEFVNEVDCFIVSGDENGYFDDKRVMGTDHSEAESQTNNARESKFQQNTLPRIPSAEISGQSKKEQIPEEPFSSNISVSKKQAPGFKICEKSNFARKRVSLLSCKDQKEVSKESKEHSRSPSNISDSKYVSSCLEVAPQESSNFAIKRQIKTKGEFSSDSDSRESCGSLLINMSPQPIIPNRIIQGSPSSAVRRAMISFSMKALTSDSSPKPQQTGFASLIKFEDFSRDKKFQSDPRSPADSLAEPGMIFSHIELHDPLPKFNNGNNYLDFEPFKEPRVRFDIPREDTETSTETGNSLELPTREFFRIFTLGKQGKRSLHVFQEVNGIIRSITSRPTNI